MLENTINGLSELIQIDTAIIPNIITFIVMLIVLYLTLKSQLNILVIVPIYLAISGVLALLGIDSVFNIFSNF